MTCESKTLGAGNVTASLTGSVDSIPAGISIGIYPLTISVSDAAWTVAGGLTATPDRRSITVLNTSGQVIYFFNNAFVALPATGEEGFPIAANSSATFACTQAVEIYLRLGTGGGSETIKGMEFY